MSLRPTSKVLIYLIKWPLFNLNVAGLYVHFFKMSIAKKEIVAMINLKYYFTLDVFQIVNFDKA